MPQPPVSTPFPYTTLFRSPLERTSNRLIEVVDVEDEMAVGRGKCAQVADVCVSAELGVQARVRQHREIGSHHRHCATEVAEGDRKSTRLNSSHANNSYAVF